MTEAERAEIIALSLDPDADFGDVQGKPPTPEGALLIARVAESLFFKRTPDEQAKLILSLPPHVSARLLAQMAASDRAEPLDRVPQDLAEDILPLIDVGAPYVL